jgi:hypothetical protein
MTNLPVTEDFRPPFAAMPFNGGWGVIDANGDFPAPAMTALGITIPGYTEGDTQWACTAEEAWCEASAATLTAAAS